jgi:predicted transcriptional regulator
MPTLSVKLTDAVKSRIDRLAAAKGTTAHAFMVDAIESQLDNEEKHEAFIRSALEARDEALASGMVYDGPEVIEYWRARMRGEKVTKPRLKSLKSYLKKPR